MWHSCRLCPGQRTALQGTHVTSIYRNGDISRVALAKLPPHTPCWPPVITAPGITAAMGHSSHGSGSGCSPEPAQEGLTLHCALADHVLGHLHHKEEKVPWLKVTRGFPMLELLLQASITFPVTLSLSPTTSLLWMV